MVVGHTMAMERSSGVGVSDEGRYAGISLDGDEYVIYDRENHRAWIQSATRIPVRDAR